MSRVTLKGGLLAAVASLSCASLPVQAAMGCWNETQTAAAQVRDLQSRLMVATMRCRAAGIDILDAYNRFVVANRSTLQGANGILRGQFESGYGIEGEHHYNRFATALANSYGGDETDPWVCAETEDLAFEAAAAHGDVGRLLQLADRLGPPPRLPGGRCGINFDAVAVEPVARTFERQEPAFPAANIEASPVPRDRFDDVAEIPAPFADAGQADEVVSMPLPPKVGPKSKLSPAI